MTDQTSKQEHASIVGHSLGHLLLQTEMAHARSTQAREAVRRFEAWGSPDATTSDTSIRGPPSVSPPGAGLLEVWKVSQIQSTLCSRVVMGRHGQYPGFGLSVMFADETKGRGLFGTA